MHYIFNKSCLFTEREPIEKTLPNTALVFIPVSLKLDRRSYIHRYARKSYGIVLS
jgi:hypothetical protein